MWLLWRLLQNNISGGSIIIDTIVIVGDSGGRRD
jgi:hypothetical protein